MSTWNLTLSYTRNDRKIYQINFPVVFVLVSCRKLSHFQSSDMMNFFTTPNTMWETGSGNVKNMSTVTPSPVQIKIPQRGTIGLADVENNNKETLNDKTRKSLLKINLFIKRQWFSIFSDSKRSEDGSSATGKDDISTAAISTFVTKPDARRLDETNQRKWWGKRKFPSLLFFFYYP